MNLENTLKKLTMQLVTDVCLLSTRASKAERPTKKKVTKKGK